MRKPKYKDSYKKCSTCGRSYFTGDSNYICENGNKVKSNGICDRWINHVSEKEFFDKIEKSLERMEPYQEGTYEIRKLPPLGTNYREK